MLWSAHHACNHPMSLRPTHRHLLGRCWEKGAQYCSWGGMGIWGGTGVCRCRAPAAHSSSRKGPAQPSLGWNLGVTSRLLLLPPFPVALARGLGAIGLLELARTGMGGPRFTAPEGNGFITRVGSVSLQSRDSAGS